MSKMQAQFVAAKYNEDVRKNGGKWTFVVEPAHVVGAWLVLRLNERGVVDMTLTHWYD